MQVDFGRTADDYARFRAGFPDSFFERLAERGIGLSGQRVVDLGTGTGALARGFARRGCKVIGIDPSEMLTEQARQLDQQAGVSVEYHVAHAEDIGLEAASADLVIAGQCWHWFDAARASSEVLRILCPGGWVVIAHFDWIPLKGNVVEATEQLIVAHNPAWTYGDGYGLYPRWLRDLGNAGFQNIETFSYDVFVPYTPDAWRGRIRASAGVGASLSPEQITAFDRELADILSTRFPGDVLQVYHRVWAVLATKP
jgi:SAM-dependent methyltransferase